MKVTFIIITKDRPRMVRNLINSILKAKLDSFSLVIIDDSNTSNFLHTRSFLRSHSIPFKQFSSLQAGRYVKKTLEKVNFTANERKFIKNCTGLSSPFCRYVERFLEVNKLKSDLISSGLQFAPYSPARNLGIYCTVRFFNPKIILFLDDDCLILRPERLESQLRLMGTKINQKIILAVSGLYKDLLKFEQKESSEHHISKKIVRTLRGMDAFLRKSFMVKKERFKIMPPHMLGGALILSKKVFHVVPFDPYVARGEDHAYALDLKSFLGENEIAIRDNHFIVDHRREFSQNHTNTNVLRDIFRFVYSHAKTGHSFITLFVFRWLFASIIQLFLNPSKHKQYKNELWALLFLAPKFAKENAYKFRQNVAAWKGFVDQSKSKSLTASA